MATKEEIQALLEEHDVPTDAIQTVIQELDSSSLRKKLGELEAWKREHGEPAVQYKQRHETLPKRKEAFQRVGLIGEPEDYDKLPQYARDALEAFPEDKLDNLEEVAAFVKAKGFEVSQEPENEPDTPPPAQAVVKQALAAPIGGNPTQITPADYASWPREQRLKFMQDHPDAIEQLKRGEVVTAR